MSPYQSREAMELRALLPRFVGWLEAAGVLVQPATSRWEVLRYRAVSGIADASADPGAKTKAVGKPRSSVIYRRGDGSLSWTGEALTHWSWFRAGSPMPDQPDDLAPAKKGKSWTERTREKLVARDGTNCWFCGRTMIGHDHTGAAIVDDRGGPRDDITIEHLLSRHNTDQHAADGVDVEHLDYLVLAHAKCNRDIGHRPMSEKVTYRDILHDQRGTMWEGDQ